MNEVEIAKKAAEAIAAAAALVAVAVPATAPVAGAIGALAALARGVAEAIGAGGVAEARVALEEADRMLTAAMRGLPGRMAAKDAEIDARLATDPALAAVNGFEESHTPPDGTTPEGSSNR